MHSAPSVSYPVGRCAFMRRFSFTLASLTFAVWAAWLMQQGLSPLVFLAGGLWLLGCAGAWRSLKQQVGWLTWDGQVWCWHNVPLKEDAVGRVVVVLDLQHTLLLQWQSSNTLSSAQSVNLWLSAESASDFWQDLRRAVYAQ